MDGTPEGRDGRADVRAPRKNGRISDGSIGPWVGIELIRNTPNRAQGDARPFTFEVAGVKVGYPLIGVNLFQIFLKRLGIETKRHLELTEHLILLALQVKNDLIAESYHLSNER